jgi:hypothetical protein
VPIHGFKHTGNIYGAGAAVEAEYQIGGHEYFGGPAPLKHINVVLPSGVKIHTKGFTTCAVKLLQLQHEPKSCPGASHAGPVGTVFGTVKLGRNCQEAGEQGAIPSSEVATCIAEEAAEERGGPPKKFNTGFAAVSEHGTITPFYLPGGLGFFTYGASPVQLQIFSGGNYTNVNGVGSSGPAFHANVPLVESLPGAPDASVERIDVKVGGARKSGKKTHYYGTLPKKCPKHYLPVATELKPTSRPNTTRRARSGTRDSFLARPSTSVASPVVAETPPGQRSVIGRASRDPSGGTDWVRRRCTRLRGRRRPQKPALSRVSFLAREIPGEDCTREVAGAGYVPRGVGRVEEPCPRSCPDLRKSTVIRAASTCCKVAQQSQTRDLRRLS